MDALTDGIFAVAMTLLVLDLRLPETFLPTDAEQLLAALLGLWPKFMPYVLSFVVLSLRWLAGVQVRSRAAHVGARFIVWRLLYLFLITCVPFTTTLVGRYASFAPALWLYGGNTALIGIAAWRLLILTPEVEDERQLHTRELSAQLLIALGVLCIGWSFVNPSQALWALLLNLAGPILARTKGATEPSETP
jgi:uncharacterized membrane protein